MPLNLETEPLPLTAIDGHTARVAASGDDPEVRWAEATPRPGPAVRAIPAVRFVTAVDVAVVMATFFAVVGGINLDAMPHGVQAFLAVRVTLKNALVIGGLMAAVVVAFRRVGLYDARRLRHWSDEARRIVFGVTVVTALATVAPLTSQSDGVTYVSLLWFWVAAVAALLPVRALRASLARRGRASRRVIIVGTGPQALRIHRELCADVLVRYVVLGFVDTTSAPISPFLARRTLGRLEELEQLLVREHVDEVYVGLPVKSHYLQIQETIRTCEQLGVRAMYHVDIFATAIARPRVEHTHDQTPRVELQMVPDGTTLLAKRALDIVGASAAILLFSPVMVAAALAIWVTSGRPIVYAQERYGLNRRRFRMFKFRTMVPNADKLQAALESRNEATGPVFKIADDPRITPVGRFLRRTSIDELPQLFNVLRGEMSLVGPRPLPMRDVERFTRTSDLRRQSMPPGLTCLWQVGGRSGVGFDEWVKLDLQYIDQWSLVLDLLILARTVPAVLRGTGAR